MARLVILEIARNYYLVSGRPKRFFSQATWRVLFASGWQVRTLVEEVLHGYAMPKIVWRVVADRGRLTISCSGR